MDIHGIIMKLLIEQPFYGYVASGVALVKTDRLKTIRMEAHPSRVIYYNPEWFDGLSDEHKLGVVLHELLHVILLHPFRRGSRDQLLWSVACDMAVNGLLPDQYKTSEAVTVEAVSMKIGKEIESGKTAEFYYDILQEGEEAFSFFTIEGDSILISEGSHSLRADVIPDQTAAQAELRALEQDIVQTLEEAGENGELPPELEDSIAEVYREYRLNWRIILKRFLTGRGKIIIRKSYKRQSRRYENLPGTKRSVGVHALLALDESGSISDTLVKEFYHELTEINRITGVSILVTRFDTQCSEPVPLSQFLMNSKREKRGGTDFRPIFRLADERRIPLVIIFTDGDGDVPSEVNQKTLWVLTKNAKKPADFGESVTF
jgi:predicted metal-dependent peptidase